MGLDALGGYVFARMAHNEGINSLTASFSANPPYVTSAYKSTNSSPGKIGHDICAYNVAAAAGAVYGAITGFFHTVIGCMAGFTHTTSTNGHYVTSNIFGTTSGYDENWQRNSVW